MQYPAKLLCCGKHPLITFVYGGGDDDDDNDNDNVDDNNVTTVKIMCFHC